MREHRIDGRIRPKILRGCNFFINNLNFNHRLLHDHIDL